MEADETLDCQSCGACCSGALPGEPYAEVTAEDLARWPEGRTDLLTTDRKSTRTKCNEQGLITCAALEGRVGSSCSCSIYENRPVACQRFEVGGDGCLRNRAMSGFF